jgi:hypothetical protein
VKAAGAECRDDPGALTSWNPKSHIRLVVEKPLSLPFTLTTALVLVVPGIPQHSEERSWL